MSTVRGTFKWMLFLVVLAAAGGGFYMYRLWQEQDRLLRKMILTTLEERYPHWNVEIGRTRFDWSRRVHLHDVLLRPEGDDAPLVRIAEIIIVVDQDQLAEDQSIVIERIDLRSPQIHLQRTAAGEWNYQRLLPIPRSQASLPDWSVRNASVQVELDREGTDPAHVSLKQLSIDAPASGISSFTFQSSLQLEDFGTLALEGEVDAASKGWSIRGQMKGVTVDEDLLQFLAGLSPQFEQQLVSLDQKLAALQSGAGSVQPRPENRHPRISSQTLPDVAGKASIDFRLTKGARQAEPDFKVLLDLDQGEIRSPFLPVTLRGVSGQLYWDREQTLFRDFSARHGATFLKLDGSFRSANGQPVRTLALEVENLELDRELARRLPSSWQKLYATLQPTGLINLSTELILDGTSTVKTRNLVVRPQGCSAAHSAFPYRVHEIYGTIWQEGANKDFEYDLTALAGHEKLTLTGYTKNVGPQAENLFQISVAGIELDDQFRKACLPDVRKTLAALQLKARCNIQTTIYRPPGLNQSYTQRITADVIDGTVECEYFPLRLDRLTGKVSFNSENRLWLFSDLKARHGDTQVNGAGFFSNVNQPGELDLTLTVKNGHFDRALAKAIPAELQPVWEQLSPSGQFHCLSKMRWIPGQPVQISLPAIQIFKGGVVIEGFPIPLKNVEARMAYADDRLDIKSFVGWHDDARVRLEGYAEIMPDQWRVRMEKAFIDDMVPDRVFRLALPHDLRSAMDTMDPRGKLSVSGVLEFRGTYPPESNVTAFWDLKTVFNGNSLWAGMQLEQMHGQLTARGTFDGRIVHCTGDIDLDSVLVLEHRISQVRGPYELHDQQLVVGSRRIMSPNPAQVPLTERVTASAIGGQLTLDAVARIGDSPSFRAIATMSSGYLEEYARLYIPGENTIKGIVNGWLDVHGRAGPTGELSSDAVTGRGQLQISPAALYELPVLVQVFKVLSFVPPDRTAFNYALVDFDVERNAFWFRSIDLVGDAISLRGKGSARFDGRVDLDFYSMLGRNASTRLPVFDVLINSATTGWVGVEVDGQVSSPRARLKVVPTIDDTLRRFLSTFNPRRRPPVTPPTLPNQAADRRGAPAGTEQRQ